MKRVITFGEIMMRLNPPGYLKIEQANAFEATFAGGEANVAVSLANFGIDTGFVTKLPDNALGKRALMEVRKTGVETKDIVFGGPRLGTYYVEKGASQRASKVIYDRAGSSIALATSEDFDWDSILEGYDWFHFTGITPALSDNCANICMEALKVCRKKGITVSCDLNYRSKLWSREKAKEVMTGLMSYVDVLIANESDAEDVFGIRADGTDVIKGELDRNGYVSVAKQIAAKFGIKKVAITLRESLSASVNNWGGMLYQDGMSYMSAKYTIQIVDRVGGGDSFGGGLIYAMISGYDPQKVIEFAAAASCIKHTIEYDFNYASLEDVISLMNGNASGRVQR